MNILGESKDDASVSPGMLMRLRVNQSFLTHVLCYLSSEIEILLSSFLYHTTTVKLIFHTSLISFPIGHRIGKARFTISVILRAK